MKNLPKKIACELQAVLKASVNKYFSSSDLNDDAGSCMDELSIYLFVNLILIPVSISNAPIPLPVISFSFYLPLCSSITTFPFHSWLNTYHLHKSFPL